MVELKKLKCRLRLFARKPARWIDRVESGEIDLNRFEGMALEEIKVRELCLSPRLNRVLEKAGVTSLKEFANRLDELDADRKLNAADFEEATDVLRMFYLI